MGHTAAGKDQTITEETGTLLCSMMSMALQVEKPVMAIEL